MKKDNNTVSKVQSAWKMYEHVFIDLKNGKMRQSNKHPLGDPDRVEHDLNEVEKSHLDLLRAKLDMEIAEEAKLSQERLQIAAWILSAALVIAAVFELFQ